MTLLGSALSVPRPMLRRDPIVVWRTSNTLDSEGNVNAIPSIVPGVDRGTWRQLTAREVAYAAQRGSQVTAQLSLELDLDVRAGDLVAVMGAQWEAVEADDLRTYRRVTLRKTST